MRHEKPQRSNPHKLTINQHIFPAASIRRFTRPNGTVHVHRIDKSDRMYFVPENSYFCARRAWDQKAESGLLKKIEDTYQEVAEQVVNGSISTLSGEMHDRVTEFYLSWILRHHRHQNPIADVEIKGVTPDRDLDINKQEILESKGYVFTRPDNTMPGRFMAGIQLLRGLDFGQEQMAGTKWGILRSTEAEFLVPDSFHKYSVVPLSPTVCLAADAENTVLTIDQVAQINSLAVECATRYFFARDLDKCPIAVAESTA